MAKMRRDTAKRSLQDLFRNLPASAVIHVTRRGTPPPNGVGAIITIEIAAPPTVQLYGLPGGTRIETAAKAFSGKTGKTPADPMPADPTPADPTPTAPRPAATTKAKTAKKTAGRKEATRGPNL